MKRKALIAGSALTLAGALAVTVTLASGGRDTAGRTSTAQAAPGAARAQHVDLTFPAPQAPAGHQFLDLRVRNGNSFHASVCVDNSATGSVCTEDFGRLSSSTDAELQNVDVDPTDNVARLTLRAAGEETSVTTSVTMGNVVTRCFNVVSAQELTEVPGCVGF